MILLPQKVAYRGTLTGLRISSVDGTAFLDACAALVPYADGSHLVEIYDASGRMLRGYLSAAGTGETLGDELFTNGDCSSDTGWVLNTGWSISGGKLVKGAAVGSSAFGYQSIVKTAGALYFGSFDVDSIASSYTALVLTGAPLLMMPTSNITGTRTGYATYQSGSNAVGAYISASGTYRDIATAQYDNFSLKRVLTPSTSGATIVSAKGGDTYNWTEIEAGFAFNQANYDIEIILMRGALILDGSFQCGGDRDMTVY